MNELILVNWRTEGEKAPAQSNTLLMTVHKQATTERESNDFLSVVQASGTVC